MTVYHSAWIRRARAQGWPETVEGESLNWIYWLRFSALITVKHASVGAVSPV